MVLSARLFGDTKLLVESLGARFPAQELLKDVHLFLTSTALEHSVPVPSAFFGIHGVVLKDRVKHVCGVDLGREVAVIATIR